MVLIKSNHDIQSWQLDRRLIKTYDMTLNHNSIMSKGYIWFTRNKYNIN